jgi:hypothetical protein
MNCRRKYTDGNFDPIWTIRSKCCSSHPINKGAGKAETRHERQVASPIGSISALIFFASRAPALATKDSRCELSHLQLSSETRRDRWRTSRKVGRARLLPRTSQTECNILNAAFLDSTNVTKFPDVRVLSTCNGRFYRGHVVTVVTPDPCTQRVIVLDAALSGVFRWPKGRRCILFIITKPI